MKYITLVLLVIIGIVSSPRGFSQGWVAEVDVDLNHELYAYETIENATFTFSGVTVSGGSSGSSVHFVLKGTGSPSGDINLSITGSGLEPYNPSDPYSQPLFRQFSGSYKTPCIQGYFKSENAQTHQQVTIWIKFYPRLIINDFVQDCNVLTLTTTTCYPTLLWEVSESLTGNFKTISGETGGSLSITHEELSDMGFNSPYGRKYFRVTGVTGTTSQLQAVDIYYRGPNASIMLTPPKCHDGRDGSIKIDISSPDESLINDFVITVHEKVPPQGGIRQVYLNDGVIMNFSDIPAGNYWIRIENNSNEIYGSCWTDFALTPLIDPEPVTIPSFDISDYNGYATKCDGSNDGTLRAKPLGGTGSYSIFEWAPHVSTTDFADSLASGTYTVRVQDSNGCWSDSYSQTLNAPEKLSVNLISSGGRNGFDVSCYDKTDGALTTQITGGVPQYSFIWSNGSNDGSLNNIGSGSYQVAVSDANGCTATQSTKLTAPEPIGFLIAETSGINCAGDHSGILEARSILSTIGNVYYSWSSGESKKEIVNKPAGIYTLTVSDDQGCAAVRSYTLKEPAAYTVNLSPSSDFNGSAIRCYGEANGELTSIVRDDAGSIITADHYTWYKNGEEWISGAGMFKLGQLASGTYKLKVAYKNSCSAETVFVLDDPPPIFTGIVTTSNYNGAAISCSEKADGSITAIASGGTGSNFSFSWETGEAGPDLKDIGAGRYVVTARDINGCESTSEKIVNSPAPVKARISVLSNYNGHPVSCFGASDARLRASANGGTAPYVYSWDPGDAGEDLVNIEAGYYSLTVSDANGCLGLADTTLMNPDPVKAYIKDISDYNGYGVACKGTANGYIHADGSGGTGVYKFTWKESVHTQPLYDNLKPGTYSVTVSDQNGCNDTTYAIITEPELLHMQVAMATHISCNDGNDGQIEVLATGGAGGYDFSIRDNEWQTGSLFGGLHAGAHEIKARDANGCSQITAQSLDQPASLTIQFADIHPALCGDPRGSVTAVVNGGAGTYKYQWRNSGGETLSSESRLSSVPPGIYSLKVLDEHLCASTRSVGITSTDGPKAIITNIVAPKCSYSRDGSASVEITHGDGPFLIEWDNRQNTNTATNLGGGNHLVQVTDSNNCKVVESVTITAPDSLETDLVEKIEPFCHGDCNGSLKVSARGGNGNYRYSWENFTGAEATNLCTGTYGVTVNDEKGCVSSRTFFLDQPDPVLIRQVTARSPACPGICDGMIEVSASGGTGALKYSWRTGQDLPALRDLCAGSYTTTVHDENNCSQTKTFTLGDPPEAFLDLGGTVTLCAGQTHMLDAGPQWQSLSWSSNTGFKSSFQQIKIADAGLYWIDALSPQGCIVQDTFLLQTSMDLLRANFLMAAEAQPGDTVVMIDISWPVPDNITWSLPDQMIRLADYGDILYGKFDDNGRYDVSLTAVLGECRDNISKTIRICEDDEAMEDGRLGHEPFVKRFSLFPNPNDGAFDVEIEFIEESPMLLTLWNTLTAKKMWEFQDSRKTAYAKHINLRPLSAGTYTLRLDYSKGTKYLRFVVR